MPYTKLCSSKGLSGQITAFGLFFGLTIKKVKDVVFSMYFKHSIIANFRLHRESKRFGQVGPTPS